MSLLSPSEFREFSQCIAELEKGGVAIDLETTGLSVYQGDLAFLIGMSHDTLGSHSAWIHHDRGVDPECVDESLRILLSNPRLRYAAHNIKFEASFFQRQFGLRILGTWWDTEVFERVLYNNYWKSGSYGLQKCAERRGLTKHPAMLAWLKAHGSKYFEAPVELIIPYVEQDANLSRVLMNDQIDTFKLWDQGVKIAPVVRLEVKTTPCLFDMEERGMRVDLLYCKEALAFEKGRAEKCAAEFLLLTGAEFVDSRKALTPIFQEAGLPFGRTEKGNDSFNYDALVPNKSHPIIRCILTHRDAAKRSSSYWENFLALTGADGKIHPSIHQTGAATSRMSIRDPAAQTWATDEPDETGFVTPFPIRRAFIPEPGCVTVSIDWSQMELRLMADEAGEMEMIDAFKTGFDFHQQTADQAGVARPVAKNGRFAKLYGAGDRKLATTLGVDLATARRVSRAIEDTSPRIEAYSQELIRYARQTGTCYNWLGRRYFFDRNFEYKAPNFRIQGGCGEILRIAICDIDEFLQARARPQTRIVVPIHDELVFNWHKDDLHLIPEVKALMISAFRSKRHLDMDASVTIGPNFYDLEAYVAA